MKIKVGTQFDYSDLSVPKVATITKIIVNDRQPDKTVIWFQDETSEFFMPLYQLRNWIRNGTWTAKN